MEKHITSTDNQVELYGTNKILFSTPTQASFCKVKKIDFGGAELQKGSSFKWSGANYATYQNDEIISLRSQIREITGLKLASDFTNVDYLLSEYMLLNKVEIDLSKVTSAKGLFSIETCSDRARKSQHTGTTFTVGLSNSGYNNVFQTITFNKSDLGLKELITPSSDNTVSYLDWSSITNGEDTFAYCENLETIRNNTSTNIASDGSFKLYMDNLTNGYSMFFWCTKLNANIISCEKIQNMCIMFCDCFQIHSVHGKWTSNNDKTVYTKPTNVTGAFKNCYNLTTVNYFDFSQVSEIGFSDNKLDYYSGLFDGCYSFGLSGDGWGGADNAINFNKDLYLGDCVCFNTSRYNLWAGIPDVTALSKKPSVYFNKSLKNDSTQFAACESWKTKGWNVFYVPAQGREDSHFGLYNAKKMTHDDNGNILSEANYRDSWTEEGKETAVIYPRFTTSSQKNEIINLIKDSTVKAKLQRNDI